MKGIVFTEFLQHVDNRYGPAITENMIDGCHLESKGAYTSVGTYPCSEMGQLLHSLAAETGENTESLLKGFGKSLAHVFHDAHASYFDVPCLFDFIESVDRRIHVEVKKLYADAELPTFVTVHRDDAQLVVDYISSRGLEMLALGLLYGSAEVYGEDISIQMNEYYDNQKRIVRLTILKR